MREPARYTSSMAPHKTITVNGRQYDAITGLPVKESAKVATSQSQEKEASQKPATKSAAETAAKMSPNPVTARPTHTATARPAATQSTRATRAPRPQQAYRQDVVRTKKVAAPAQKPNATKKSLASSATAASAVHASTLQHSETLNRRSTRKPAVTAKPLQHTNSKPASTRQMDVARSKRITHFAANPVVPEAAPVKTSPSAASPDAPVQTHPVAHRALSHLPKRKTKVVATATPKTAKQVKEEELKRALAAPKPAPIKRKGKARRKRTLSTKARIAIIVGSIAIVLLVVAFAIYRFVPTISVNVAASQAGISATYPEYTPDGYSLHQPVSYKDGEVDLKFASNSNNNYYTITQTRSSWDSSAVLDNVVTPAAGDDYVTTKERGLTIYTYDSVATWVNGGILYTIDSKAPLSGEQIRRIATSL